MSPRAVAVAARLAAFLHSANVHYDPVEIARPRLSAGNDSFRFTDGTSMSRFCDVLILRNLHSPTRTAAIGCYRVPMDPLYRRASIQSILGTILFIALIFWPAGTFRYWQGWLFLAVFSASTNAFGIYLALYDKPL